MITLHKYISTSVFKYFFLIQFVISIIYLSVDFVEKIDNFITASLPLKVIFFFFLCKVPFIFVQVAPIGFLLAIVLFFGFMNKNKELMALQCCGIGFGVLVKSVLILSLAGSIVVFAISESTIPLLAGKISKIWLNDVKKKNVVTSPDNDIWLKTEESIVHIHHYFPSKKEIVGLTINYFDDFFIPVRRIDAKTGMFEEGKCILHNVIEQRVNHSTDTYDVILHKTMNVNIDLDTEDLERIGKRSDEMSLLELRRYAKKIEFQGYDAKCYWVDYHNKISFCVLSLIFTMFGAGIALGNGLYRGIPLNLTYGICVAFVYWIIHGLCVSLGYAGVMAPLISAWMANLVFSFIAIFILLRIE